MAELEHDAIDIIIISQINAHHFSEDLPGHGNAGERKDYTLFYFHCHRICLATFLFLHGIGKNCFRKLVKHYKLNGVSARMHGNHKRKPLNAAHFEDKELTVHFIAQLL